MLPASALACRAVDLPCFAVVVLAVLTGPFLSGPFTLATQVGFPLALLAEATAVLPLPPDLAECAELWAPRGLPRACFADLRPEACVPCRPE